MGRYKSIAKISGTWADLQLCIDGTARRKSSLTRERWRNAPSMKRCRDSARDFAGAMTAAGATVSSIPDEMRALARRLPQNHIASLLRSFHTPQRGPTDAYTFEEALPALHGLDISQNRDLSARLFVRTIGDPLQPNAIHIQGLRDAADAIGTLPGHRLQFRLHFCFTRFREATLEGHAGWMLSGPRKAYPQPESAWLSPDIVPEAGLRMALTSPDPDEPLILFMGVEWRQVPDRTDRGRRARASQPARNPAADPTANPATTKGRRGRTTAKAPEGWGILKVVTLFRPAKDLGLPRPACLHPRRSQRYRPTIAPRHKVNLAGLTPAMQLRRALPILGTTNEACTAHIGFIPAPPRRPARNPAAEPQVHQPRRQPKAGQHPCTPPPTLDQRYTSHSQKVEQPYTKATPIPQESHTIGTSTPKQPAGKPIFPQPKTPTQKTQKTVLPKPSNS